MESKLLVGSTRAFSIIKHRLPTEDITWQTCHTEMNTIIKGIRSVFYFIISRSRLLLLTIQAHNSFFTTLPSANSIEALHHIHCVLWSRTVNCPSLLNSPFSGIMSLTENWTWWRVQTGTEYLPPCHYLQCKPLV